MVFETTIPMDSGAAVLLSPSVVEWGRLAGAISGHGKLMGEEVTR